MLVQTPLGGQALLLGVEIRPGPGQALIAAIMGAVPVWGLPCPEADALAADLATIAPQAQSLAAIVIEAVHRAGIGEQRRAMLRHCGRDADERLLCLEDQPALALVV